MKHRLLILALILLSGFSFISAQSRFSIKTSLDSAHLLMGRQTDINIEVLGPIDSTATVASIDSMWNKIELVSQDEAIITDMGNGQRQLTKRVRIQAFEPGLYSVPAFLFIQGDDSVLSSRAALKVLPVEADSLNMFENVVAVNDDNLPLIDFSGMSWLWWSILALIILCVIGYFVMKYYRKGSISLPLKSAAKPVPPYELAIAQLNKLKEEHLWERGAEKLYYTRLTDILRTYLSGRFGINAMEMTSSQILDALKADNILLEMYPRIKASFAVADYVKFAKLKPTREENESSYSTVVKFVEDTRPVDEPDSEAIDEIKENTIDNTQQEN